VTRQRRLREVLNVRLDEALAREIQRIAFMYGQSESEVARTLLGYGIEVVRRLQAPALARPFAWKEERDDDDPWPGIIEIEARWRPMTDEEVDRHGLREYVGGYGPDDEEDLP
jgi:hypothetical protein